jgi:hypothetical protein
MNTTVSTGITPIDDILRWYTSIFSHKYKSLWIVEAHPHLVPLITIPVYLSVVFILPKILTSFQATKKGINLGFILPAWNLFLSIWSAGMFFGVLFPYAVRV